MLTKFEVLELSTAHLTENVAKTLEEIITEDKPAPPEHWSWQVVGNPFFEYGWWIYAHPDGFDEMPPSLKVCLQLAQDEDCNWIRFDRDADPTDKLPTYEW